MQKKYNINIGGIWVILLILLTVNHPKYDKDLIDVAIEHFSKEQCVAIDKE